jgi:cell division septation protein DedD
MGAFSTREEADAFAEQLRSKGFEANIEQQIVPGLGTRHQVRSGLFDTYNEAQAQLRTMEKALKVAGITVPVATPLEP